jgi:hypothetical protein
VRDVGKQGSQRHNHLDVEAIGRLEYGLRERTPAQVRLDSADDQDVAFRVGRHRGEDVVRGPVDLAGQSLGHPNRGPGDLEVIEVLRVDLGDLLGIE